MIGADTNILLRHTLADDVRQSPVASRVLTERRSDQTPVLVNAVVLAEFVWTLLRRERFVKPRVLELLDTMAASDRIAFVDADAVFSAIESWRTGPADFQDYLIAALNLQAGARTTLTFDKTAVQGPGFSLLAS